MRQVRGSTDGGPAVGGRWGISDALPAPVAAQASIKNGWTMVHADGQWRVNCLAITDDWVLAVQPRYPEALGLDHGAGVCRDVARQVLDLPESAVTDDGRGITRSARRSRRARGCG